MQIITTTEELDIPMIHRFLSKESAWARGIPFSTIETAIHNSLCFGGFLEGQQIAFARVVTDKATFAYLMDVFVLPAYRNQGHSKALLEAVLAHPDCQNLRRFILVSSNARGLYAKYGFAAPVKPETFMEINRSDMYNAGASEPNNVIRRLD